MANTKVTGDVIANGTISTVHLADDAITAAKLDSTATGITFADLTVDTDTLYVDAANNRVGIGTTSPERFLHINSSNVQVAALIESTNTTSAQLNFRNGSTTNNGGFIKTTGDNIILTANNTSATHLVVASGGNVGINDTLGYGKLAIKTSGTFTTDSNDNDFSGVNIVMKTDNTATNAVGSGMVWIKGGSSARKVAAITNYIYGDTDQSGLNFYVQPTASGSVAGLTEAMRIDNTGNVGIGTTSPERKLHVFKGESGGATSNSDSSLVLENSSNTYLQFLTPTTVESGILFGDTDNDVGALTYSHSTNRFNFRTAGVSNRMVIDSSGNVGIGQTGPGQKLVIGNYGSAADGTMRLTALGGQPTAGTIRNSLEFSLSSQFSVNNGDAYKFSIGLNSAVGNAGSYNSDFVIRRTTRLGVTDNVDFMIDGTSGNVGIGTTTPSATLHVQTSNGIKLFNDATYGYISIGSSGLTGQYPYLRVDSFRSDGSGYMWAFGHETPSGVKSIKMLINDNANDEVTIIRSLAISTFASNEFNSAYPSFSTGALIRANNTSYFNGGNVGIGITTPNAKLSVAVAGADGLQLEPDTGSTNNSARIFWKANTGAWAIMNNSQNFSIRSGAVVGSTSGTEKIRLTGYSATSWTSGSDETIKENIKSIGNVLNKINDYRCVEYNLIDDETKDKKIGFIAQDWQEDFPQIIEQMENEKIGMKYTETIPILLKAIQELKADNDSLRARIEILENN